MNELLGLPSLDDRSPDEAIRRDNRSGPDDSDGGGSLTLLPDRPKKRRSDALRLRGKLARALEEIAEHSPRGLLIAGDVRASHKIVADRSELRVVLRPMEKPTYVEVLSGQDICLGFAPIPTVNSDGDLKQITNVQLGDERSMSIAISFTAESPTIQVSYFHRLTCGLVIIINILLGGFDEWSGHQHFVLSWIGACPARRRVPCRMLEEVRINRIRLVVFPFHYLGRCIDPSLLH